MSQEEPPFKNFPNVNEHVLRLRSLIRETTGEPVLYAILNILDINDQYLREHAITTINRAFIRWCLRINIQVGGITVPPSLQMFPNI
jgi:hypothetical protein